MAATTGNTFSSSIIRRSPNLVMSSRNPNPNNTLSIPTLQPSNQFLKFSLVNKRIQLRICQKSINTHNAEDTVSIKEELLGGSEPDNNGSGGRNWTASFLLLLFWGGLMYYIFNLSPNQTAAMDIYLAKKMLYLIGNDGHQMNQVFVSVWYIIGLWILMYNMLLLPTGRSSKGNIPMWPFLVLSWGLGAYALLPYFVMWKPPPPSIKETELRRWPLNFTESKLTAGITIAAGLGLITYAGLANGDVWLEFYQYFRQSRFIHVTCIDFSLLSAFAPFWVFNDMRARKCDNKMSWLLPLLVVPFLGPALYLLLRPSLSALPNSLSSTFVEEN